MAARLTDRLRALLASTDRRRLAKAALAASVVLLAAGAAWTWRLHRQISTTWTLHRSEAPSRVYAAPTHLYPGRGLSRREVIRELGALGYRRTGADPEQGEFRVTSRGLVVGLHDVRYPPPRGLVRGFRLRLDFVDGRIRRMRNLDRGRAVLDVDLEPRRIATLVDARMIRRDPVPLEEVPAELVQAVLAVEDREFFHHAGLDLSRIAAAALANVREGRLAQGGSTLTQQLVKNFYLAPEKSFVRKLREAAMAVVLEATRGKAEILEAYLNTVYLGRSGASGLVGVGQAARHYFSRDVANLDLAQSALLAGMVRAPNRYAPDRHPEAARRRRDLVLRLMEEQGRITADERERASAKPLPSGPGEGPVPVNRAPWFTDLVERELESRFPREDLRQEGLSIFTTLRPRAQAAAESAVGEGLAALEEEHPRLRSRDGEPVQAALVALDPGTGDVLALVGGRSFRETQFNRAVRARRQPGSLFKPFVYLAALADTAGGWTLATPIADTSFTVRSGGEAWSPSNHDGEEHGEVSLRRALEESYNVATARLALEVGLGRVLETARGLGLSGDLRPLPSLALGAFEVTPLEMASAYAGLAAAGIRPEPLSVLDVVGQGGEALEARDLQMSRVAPPGPVHLVNRALQGVLLEGTAAGARAMGYEGPSAGKTGTTSGYRDAWFVGYTPDLVTLVWVGFDDNRPLGLTGAEAALPIWVRFVEAWDARGGASFTTPGGVVTATVERRVGEGDEVETECREEYFLEGTVPEETCDQGWWIF